MGNDVFFNGARVVSCGNVRQAQSCSPSMQSFEGACLPSGFEYSRQTYPAPQGQVIYGQPQPVVYGQPQQAIINQPQTSSHVASNVRERLHLSPNESVVSNEELLKHMKINESNKSLIFKIELPQGPSNVQYSLSRANNQGYSSNIESFNFNGNNSQQYDGCFVNVNGQQVFQGKNQYNMAFTRNSNSTTFEVNLDAKQMEGFRVTVGGKTYLIIPSEIKELLSRPPQVVPPQVVPPQVVPPQSNSINQVPQTNVQEQLSERDRNRPQAELKSLEDTLKRTEELEKKLDNKATEITIPDRILRKIEKMEARLAPDKDGKYPMLGPGVRDAMLNGLPEYEAMVQQSMVNDPEQYTKALNSIIKIKEYLHANHGGNQNAPQMPDRNAPPQPGVQAGSNPGVPPQPGVQPGSNPGVPPQPGVQAGSNIVNQTIPPQPGVQSGSNPGVPPQPGVQAGSNTVNQTTPPPSPGVQQGSNPATPPQPGVALTPEYKAQRDSALANLIDAYYDEHSKHNGAFNLKYSSGSGGILTDHQLNPLKEGHLKEDLSRFTEIYGKVSAPSEIKTKQGEFYCFFGENGGVTILDKSSLYITVKSSYEMAFGKKSDAAFGEWTSRSYSINKGGKTGYSLSKIGLDGEITHISCDELNESRQPSGKNAKWTRFNPSEAMNEIRSWNTNQSGWTSWTGAYDLNDANNANGFKVVPPDAVVPYIPLPKK